MAVHGWCDNAMHNDVGDPGTGFEDDNIHTGIYETDAEFGAYVAPRTDADREGARRGRRRPPGFAVRN